MPLINPHQEQFWTQLYQCNIDGEIVHFQRAAKEQILGEDHWKLLEALDIRRNDRILLVGAGFGWIAEDWIEQGYDFVVCTDTSEWIQSNLDGNAIVPILNESSLTEQSRQNLGTFDIIITEDVLPILSDEECLELSNCLNLMSSNVNHWVTCGSASSNSILNNKSLQGWKELLPNDRFIKRGSSEVI